MEIYSSNIRGIEFTVDYCMGVYLFIYGELKSVLSFRDIDESALEDIVECFEIPRHILLDIAVRIIDISASTTSLPTKYYITDDCFIKCNSYLVTPWREIKLIGMIGDKFYNEISYLLEEFCTNLIEFEVNCFQRLTPYLGMGLG